MGKEIERKFLVQNNIWKINSPGTTVRQGYLNRDKNRTVRIRIYGNKACITIKGITRGISRSEFEYKIPKSDGELMLKDICEQPVIHKTRYEINYKKWIWTVDEFHGENKGLVVAEIELEKENDEFEIPVWIGKEVSFQAKYYNSNLIKKPFNTW